MYNKLFTKILDSSIWLEDTPTRIVWLTLIAAMDEQGIAQFASVANIAHRARVSNELAEVAIACLEGPDPESSDPDHDGRRIERIPGGWLVLNAEKYRAIVTKSIAQERTRERVRKHRERIRNASVTGGTVLVTPSEAEAEADTEEDQGARALVPPNWKPATRTKATTLHDGPEARHHGSHEFCGRLCVPHTLHVELSQKLGTADAHTQLLAWYPTVLAQHHGQPIGDTLFTFWQNEFATWVGTVTSKPHDGKGGRSLAAMKRVLIRRQGGEG